MIFIIFYYIFDCMDALIIYNYSLKYKLGVMTTFQLKTLIEL